MDKNRHSPACPPFGSEVPVSFLGDKYAFVDEAGFDALLEYSTTLPTGTTIGKRWKAHRHGRWYLCEYAECDPPDPKNVAILRRELVVKR